MFKFSIFSYHYFSNYLPYFLCLPFLYFPMPQSRHLTTSSSSSRRVLPQKEHLGHKTLFKFFTGCLFPFLYFIYLILVFGYFSFLFFGKCYAIVCVYFCLGEPVKLCVCLHACFLVFKAFRIYTDVLAAYTLYSFKHLIASRTFHNHSVHFLCLQI